MRHIYSLFILMLITCSAVAQFPEKLAYPAALEKANAGHRLLLVQISAASGQVFRQAPLADSLKKYCLVMLLTTDKERAAFRKEWKEEVVPSFVYFSGDGKVQAKSDTATGNANVYLQALDVALQHRDAAEWLSELEEKHAKNSMDLSVLEELIQAKNRLNQPIDTLLEQYADALPDDSLPSLRVLGFIAQQAPALNTKANQVLRNDADAFLKAWNALPVSQRILLNNKIITKTVQKAVADQDQQEAYLAATFAANTNKDVFAKNRAFDGNMMDYYYGVKDTARFLQLANTYYDRNLMPINADSLKQVEAARQRRGVSHFYAMELGKGAKRVLEFTQEPRYLNKAVLWVEKSIALYELSDNVDTYARLNYKLSDKETAIAQEKKAIALKKKEGGGVKEWEGVLKRMEVGGAL